MESTSGQLSRSLQQDWFFAHADYIRQTRETPRPQEVQNFLGFLWPVALDYYSPLNPFFLADYPPLSSIPRRRGGLARDGLISLLWFFKRNPTPGKFDGNLWVHRSLEAWVPKAWRPLTGTYEIESIGTRKTGRTRQFLLLGIGMESYCSLRHLESQLAEIASVLSPAELARAKISAFLPGRYDGFGNEHSHGYYGEFVRRILGTLGLNVEFIDWRRVEAMASLSGYEVVEFNEKLLCADSYLLHFTLSRGATLFRKPTRNSSRDRGTLVQLSPFHGMRLRKRISGKSYWESEIGRVRLTQAMLSDANQRFPWPSWFTDWSKIVLKSGSRDAK